VTDGGLWRPTASIQTLRRRASALAITREFFAARAVLEVETPAMVNAPVSDVNLGNLRVDVPGRESSSLYLHTSPEYAMKRLLAAGCGDIYQICRVYRGSERGRQHNPEFTMLEWYRLGFSLEDLMREVGDLTRLLLGVDAIALPSEFVSYREAVRRFAGFDPLEAAPIELERVAQSLGFDAEQASLSSRDQLLDLIVGAKVGPALGQHSLTFMHGYPASQAALARLDADDPGVARRFELYHRGMELANGYHELTDAAEQRARFAADQELRSTRGLPTTALDRHMLDALEAGMPDCAGVALGFDRVLMLAIGAQSIDEVLAFPVERA
jgi:lysyl-tRNA synthetase class 2